MKLQSLLLLTILCYSQSQVSAQNQSENMENTISNEWIVADLIKKWEGNKTYTLGVLEAMPEEHYDFKPMEEMMSFQEQALHIANGFHYQIKLGEEKSPFSNIDETSKETIIASYEKVFDSILDYLKQVDPTSLSNEGKAWFGQATKLRAINLMDNHLAHHRGQLIVYLRLKGIKPPKYIGW